MASRLLHYTLDIVLITTVLAGVKRANGFQFSTAALPEGFARSTADTVLGVGERVFDYTTLYSISSPYFEKAKVDAKRY